MVRECVRFCFHSPIQFACLGIRVFLHVFVSTNSYTSTCVHSKAYVYLHGPTSAFKGKPMLPLTASCASTAPPAAASPQRQPQCVPSAGRAIRHNPEAQMHVSSRAQRYTYIHTCIHKYVHVDVLCIYRQGERERERERESERHICACWFVLYVT